MSFICKLPCLLLASVLSASVPAFAQVALVRSETGQAIFRGQPQTVDVSLRNAGDTDVSVALSFRLWRKLASTAAPLGEAQACSSMTLPAGVTVTRTVPITLPEDASGNLLVQWITDETKALGAEPFEVVAADALKELAVLAANTPVLLHDPENALKPALDQAGVKTVALQTTSDIPRDSRLALIGPFSAPSAKTPPLPVALRKALRQVPAVIAPQETSESPLLRGQIVQVTREGGQVEVRFPTGFLRDPGSNARSQLRLLELTRLSLQPDSQTRNP